MSNGDTNIEARLALLEQEVRRHEREALRHDRAESRGHRDKAEPEGKGNRTENHAALLAGLANQGKGLGDQGVLDLDAFTIAQFCARHEISRATYYVLKKRGLQPAETHVLDRIIITKESAAAWRKKRTAESRRRQRRA